MSQTPTPASDARRAAARTNGAKSHGPSSPQGKAQSAKNAIRHGLFAQTLVLQSEDPGAFIALVETLKRVHQPQDETEHGLIETMAAARWQILRLQAILTASLDFEIQRLRGTPAQPETTNLGLVTLAYRNLSGGILTPDTISRHESRLERQFTRSLNLLIKKHNFPERTQEGLENTDQLVWDATIRTEPFTPPPPAPDPDPPPTPEPHIRPRPIAPRLLRKRLRYLPNRRTAARPCPTRTPETIP